LIITNNTNNNYNNHTVY